MKRDYIVEGMTCEHCALSVREELSEVGGVEQVDVNLASGRVSVTGSGFSDDDLRNAVGEAGYRLAA
jgi:copper chaperone